MFDVSYAEHRAELTAYLAVASFRYRIALIIWNSLFLAEISILHIYIRST